MAEGDSPNGITAPPYLNDAGSLGDAIRNGIDKNGEAITVEDNAFLAHLRRALNAEDETFEKNGLLDQLIKGIKSFFAVEEDPVAKENEAFEVINERLAELNKKLEAGARLTPEQAKEFETLTSSLERMLERASGPIGTGSTHTEQVALYTVQAELLQNMLDTTRAINAKQALVSLDDAAKKASKLLDTNGDGSVSQEEVTAARAKLNLDDEALKKIMDAFQGSTTGTEGASNPSTTTQSGAQTESNQAKSKELGKEQEPVKIESLSPEEVQMNQLELLFRMNMQRAGKPDAEIKAQWEKLKTQVQDNPEMVKQMVQDEFAKHQAGEVQRQFALREDVLKKSELVGASVSGFAPLAPLGQAISATAAASRLIGYFNPSDDMQPAPGLRGMGQAREVTPPALQPMGGR